MSTNNRYFAVGRWVAGALATAIAARLLYGPAFPGYDAAWALLWGRDLADGHLPTFDAPIAPTPHPLSNIVATMLGLGGVDASIDVLAGLGWLAFGALGAAAFSVGRAMGGPLVGVTAAVLLLARPLLAAEALSVSLDIPFLAFVMVAVALAVNRGPASIAPLVALLPAGLLRPEGWLLAAAWACVVGRRASGRRRLQVIALAAAAPVIWGLSDLLLTGNPLFSFTGTRELADTLGRPQTIRRAGVLAGAATRDILGGALFAAGIVGLIASLFVRQFAVRVVAALVAVGVGAFLLYGLAGLPVLARYTLIPASALTLLAAWVLAGWAQPGSGSGDQPRGQKRLAWTAVAAMFVVLVIAGAGDTRERVQSQKASLALRTKTYALLRAQIRSDAVVADLRACPVLLVPNHRAVPLAALWSGRSVPGQVRAQKQGVPARGLAILPTTESVASLTILDPRDADPTPTAPPAGWAFRGGNAGWAWYRKC